MAVVLEVRLMIVTPQKEPATEVNVRIEEVMTLAAVVEDMVAVTEVMEDRIAVTHPLIGVMALPLIVPGQEAMAEGPQQIGHTLQVHILEVSLRTFQFSTKLYFCLNFHSYHRVDIPVGKTSIQSQTLTRKFVSSGGTVCLSTVFFCNSVRF